MTKISLGPTEGVVDDEEFDIIDDVLLIVDEYKQSVGQIQAKRERKILDIEIETEEKLLKLKSELKIKLGVKNETDCD